MERDDLIKNMRDRAERCRRLSRQMLDEQSVTALRQMADEIERDLNALLEEKHEIPPPQVS